MEMEEQTEESEGLTKGEMEVEWFMEAERNVALAVVV